MVFNTFGETATYITRNTVSNAHKMIPPAPRCFELHILQCEI